MPSGAQPSSGQGGSDPTTSDGGGGGATDDGGDSSSVMCESNVCDGGLIPDLGDVDALGSHPDSGPPPPQGPIVRVYRDAYYGGTEWDYDKSTGYVGAAANDQMTSFKVLQHYTVVFYDDINYSRPFAVVKGDTVPAGLDGGLHVYGHAGNVPTSDNDIMSSLKIWDPSGKQL